jgi:adenylate cyclase class 2
MNQKIEKEAKFYMRGLKKVEHDLLVLGAVCTQSTTFETNLRFDTPDRSLSAAMHVLRLRQDTRARLTYKGPSDASSTVSARPEYEVEISDLDTGRRILESLGYQVVTIYEKYRASYQLADVEISLDQMPFGDFIEIEGPNEAAIQLITGKLGLTWENRSVLSYMRLFDTVKKNLGMDFRDLTFENFNTITIKPEHLQLQFADHD